MKVNWRTLDADILQAIGDLERKGFKDPTIRAVYYLLGSLSKIPLVQQGYKSLDAKIVKMRREGAIPWGFFAVKRGRSVNDGVEHYYSPEQYADDWTDEVEETFRSIRNPSGYEYRIPRWYKQPNMVEVWVEKEGLLGAVSNWFSGLDVTVRALQGYGAWEFIHSAVGDIRAKMDALGHETARILYLGDLDPSGKDIPRFMNEDALKHFGLEVDFTELALTVDQVRTYGLPEIPDAPEVRAKIERDPRLNAYRKV